VLLTPFHLLVPLSTSARLCTCLFGLRSRPRGLIFLFGSIVAEADVRVRVRGRIVSVHRQRRQVRVVSVVAAAETTNRRISAAALSFCERTQPHHRRVLPFSCAVWPMAWISVYCGSGTAAIHKPQTNASGVYFSFSAAGAALAGRAVFVFGRSATAGFRRRAIALLCFRRSLRSLSQRFDNRCRSR
jgi:hypothetical protein